MIIFDIFCFNFGAAVAKIFNKYKKISPEKSFWKLQVLVFPPKPQFSKLLDLLTVVMAGRTKLRVSKNFFRGISYAFVEYLCNHCLKIKTKSIKNYISILAIINHRNWLDESPHLRLHKRLKVYEKFVIAFA